MKYYFSFLILLVFTFGCRDIETSDSTIAKRIQIECELKKDCLIDMNNLVSGGWDRMYIFKENMSLEQINSTLGFEYPYFEDIAKRIVFVKGNRVIFHEDEFPGVETTKNCELVFDLGDKVSFKSYSPGEAIFKVRRIEFSNGIYFKLTQIE